MSDESRVRLSTHVVFINYGAEVEIQHAVRGSKYRIDRLTYEDLLRFQSFHLPEERHSVWLEAGVLVPPFQDAPEHHGGLRAGSEAQLAHDYQSWYWAHEVESEREYRWLGRTVLKMPSDLFFYQQLITAHHITSILEIGSGEGGGLWFFGTVLSLLNGGTVAGVDFEPPAIPAAWARLARVRFEVIKGDAHENETIDAAHALRPSGFGLVVIDADPDPKGKMQLLRAWSGLVARGGYLIVEDIESPRCKRTLTVVQEAIDGFLLRKSEFGIYASAAQSPLLKARGCVLQRRAT